jgi:L-ribulose-5-phosphate 3-epimerase
MSDSQLTRARSSLARGHSATQRAYRHLGILQGRLTTPWNGELQCFPRGHWEDEFFLARECGFDSIELVAEAINNPDNPIWTSDGRRRISEMTEQTGVRAGSLCADCFMSITFARERDVSLELLGTLVSLGFHRLVLPFMGPADLGPLDEAEQTLARVATLAGHGVELAIESTLPAESLRRLIDGTPLSVCYDTGNQTAMGYDIVREIYTLGPLISHVHVKDKRRSDGQNVILGTGDADLAGAFAALRKVGYAGEFTLETNRGNNPAETARLHRELVEGLLR